MKKLAFEGIFALCAVAAFASSTVFADGSLRGSAEEARMNQKAGKSGKMTEKGMMNQTLGPHAVLMQSSLMSALDQVKGLKTQLQVDETPSSEMIDHLKTHSDKINDGIQTAMTHNKHLQNRAKDAGIQQEQSLKSVNESIAQLQSSQKKFSQDMKSDRFWQQKQKVSQDLDRLEQSLTAALDRTKSFSSDQLNLDFVG